MLRMKLKKRSTRSRSNRNTFLYLLILTVTVMSSCKVTKDADRKATIYRSPEKVIELTQEKDLQYKNLSMRASVTVSDGKKNTSFKASIRMHKDSVIWSSLSLLGIAGAKTLITQDSIKIVNYKERTYISEHYDVMQSYLNSDILSLSNLQKIILGDWFYIAENDKYRLKYNDTNYVVSTISERRLDKDWMEKKIDRLEKKIERQEEKDADKAKEILEKKQKRKPRKYEGLAIEVQIDPYDLKVKSMLVKDYYFNGMLKTEYSDFKEVDNNLIPHHVNMTVEGSNFISLDIDLYKISLDHDISTPFSIPAKYKKVEL